MPTTKRLAAVPIERGKRYRRKRAVRKHGGAASFFTAAALMGAAAGLASVVDLPEKGASAWKLIKPLAVSAGLVRARPPRVGDHWSGCNSARAAGTAPIYIGEPGYREKMDGDGDGIACEPYPGMR